MKMKYLHEAISQIDQIEMDVNCKMKNILMEEEYNDVLEKLQIINRAFGDIGVILYGKSQNINN